LIDSALKLFAKTYRVAAFFVAAILFFVFYNSYIVDHSLVNLRLALNSVAEAQTVEDLRKIQPLLKIPLMNEVSKKEISSELLLSLETADSMLENAKTEDQKYDVNFYLKNAIRKKEEKRNKLLVFLDKFTGFFSGAKLDYGAGQLKNKAAELISKINSTRDKDIRQSYAYSLGNVYMQLKDFEKAKEAFSQSVDFAPDSPLAWKARFNLAFCYKYSGDREKALALFEEVGKNTANLNVAVTGQYESADTLYRLGRYEQARDRYAELANSNPQLELSVLALQRAGVISQYELEDFKSALQFYYKLGLLRAGGVSFSDLKDIESALKFFSELEEKLKRSDPAVLHIKNYLRKIMAVDSRLEGYRLLKEKQYTEAIVKFRKALTIDPRDSLSLAGESLAWYWLGSKDEAYSKAKEAVSLGTGDEMTVTNALFVYLNTDHAVKSVEVGKKFMGERRTAIRSPQFYYNLAYAFILSRSINEGVTLLNRAIKLDEDFVFSYNNIGCAFWSKKDYNTAMKMFQKAISLHPSYADAYFNLGVVYFQLGRLDDAYQEFQLSVDANPEQKDAKNYLEKIESALKYKPSETGVGQQAQQSTNAAEQPLLSK